MAPVAIKAVALSIGGLSSPGDEVTGGVAWRTKSEENRKITEPVNALVAVAIEDDRAFRRL